MKKIPLLLILFLTLSMVFAGFSADNTSAMFKDDEGWPWWSVEELLAYREEVLQEERELCGEDIECRDELFFSKLENGNEKDNKFSSLQMLIEQRFVVTSVNPTTGVVKVLYNDEDEWMRRMGIDEREDLNMLYVGWFEENPEQIYSLPGPIENYLNDEVEGAHKIYGWQIGSEEDYILNPGEEVELPAGTDLSENTFGKIGYVAEANYFNAVGQFDYGSCMAELDYQSGVECKLMLAAGKASGYSPPREIVEEDNGFIDEISVSEALTTEVGLGGEVAVAIEQKNETERIEAPETGEIQEEKGKVVEMPWWMAVIIASGVGTAAWLFWPNHKKNKNCKKTLDKDRYMR
ncbi:hypothetical protein IKF67_02625 [Candidatus Saccharibacteria bacterium]|nr:hypothetical protein [Candidatus Saccharibacteria bacterium]